MIKKLFSHTAIYGLAPQIGNFAQFLILPIITKDLTATDFGVAGIMSAYTTAISVFSLLGLRLILVNSFYKFGDRYKWIWRQLYGFLIIWNFIYAFLLAVLIYFIVPEAAAQHRWLIMFLNVAPLIFFGPTSSIGSLMYQLKQMPLQIGTRTAVFGVLSALLSLYFISYMKMGYLGWFISTFIVGILSNISYWYPLNRLHGITPIFSFKKYRLKESLKVSLPTIPHYYSSYLLNSSDKLVMDFVQVSTQNIGRYQAAYTIGNIFQQLGYASGNAVTPMIMKMFKEKKERNARNLIFLLQALFLLGTFLSCIWLRDLFTLIFHKGELVEMFKLGVIIIMSYNYRPMYQGAVNKIFYIEKTKILWRITFGAGLINLVSNFFLIPIYGFEAAAWTTFISMMLMGYSGYWLKDFKKNNTEAYYPLPWLGLTILLTFLAYYLVDLNLLSKLIVSISLIILLLYFMYRYRNLIQQNV